MSSTIPKPALQQLQRAFQDGRLTLFLGSGCSVESGVPAWDRLVTQLYINGIARHLGRYERVPALVSAVGLWAFRRQVVPLEVAARGLSRLYYDDEDFLQTMKMMLYGLTGLQQWSRPRSVDVQKLLSSNRTLRSIARLCRQSIPGKRGVHSVITYNYDNLLEGILGKFRFQSIWKTESLKPRRLPIYHVHGFVPLKETKGSKLDEIVLSEDQYHRAAHDPYSWNNLVQMQALSESVGLMVGLSLTDRNLRRILDSLRAMPRRSHSYALMRRPAPWKVEEKDQDSIVEHMRERVRTGYYPHFNENALASLDHPRIRKSILNIIRDLETLDWRREETILAELGVTVLWYESHDEIERLISDIIPARV